MGSFIKQPRGDRTATSAGFERLYLKDHERIAHELAHGQASNASFQWFPQTSSAGLRQGNARCHAAPVRRERFFDDWIAARPPSIVCVVGGLEAEGSRRTAVSLAAEPDEGQEEARQGRDLDRYPRRGRRRRAPISSPWPPPPRPECKFVEGEPAEMAQRWSASFATKPR